MFSFKKKKKKKIVADLKYDCCCQIKYDFLKIVPLSIANRRYIDYHKQRKVTQSTITKNTSHLFLETVKVINKADLPDSRHCRTSGCLATSCHQAFCLSLAFNLTN